MKSTLSITHNCNLGCSYCYSGKKFNKEMPWETAKKAVDFSFNAKPEGDSIEFGFFGGEPLLKFKLIRKIVAYIRKKEQELSRMVNMQITTNGTLITPEILSFIKQEEIGLCFSIDGPKQIQDKERRYKNGKSSFTKVINNLKTSLDKLDKIQVNAVYSPDTLSSLPETVDFFVKFGVPLIHLNPNIVADWQHVKVNKIKSCYDSIAQHYINYYLQGREISINQIDSKIITFLKGGYDASDRCGMGETEWGIAPSGNIYPCERFIGEDDGGELCMGNVHSGLHHFSRCSVIKNRGNKNTRCVQCSLQKYCMNWCGCTNYSMTGKTNLASSFLCTSEKASMGAAQLVLSSLKKNDLFIDHFYRYLEKDNQLSAIAI